MKCSIVLAATLVWLPLGVSGQGINDAQIAAIVVTANQVDIDAGKLAVERAGSEKVKAFAQLMVTDHTGVNKAATDLVTRLKVTPQANPTSSALQAGGDKNLAHLQTLSGAAFDKAYAQQMVEDHQKSIAMFKQHANSPQAEVKQFVTKTLPTLEQHLKRAQQAVANTK